MIKHDVVIVGKIASEEDTNVVASRLAELFKISMEQAMALLTGQAVAKHDVDAVTAQRYQAALQKIGVQCEIRTGEEFTLDTLTPFATQLPIAASPVVPAASGAHPSGLIYCHGCGTQIHASAAACPKCGATARNVSQLANSRYKPTIPRMAINNPLVWILAFAPLIGGFIEGIIAFTLHGDNEYLATAAWFSWRYWFVTLGINIGLCYADMKQLKTLDIDIQSTFKGMEWVVPVYLYRRAEAFGHSSAYFVTWMISFGLTMLIHLSN